MNEELNAEIAAHIIGRSTKQVPLSVWFEDDRVRIYLRAGKQFNIDPANPCMTYVIVVSNVAIKQPELMHTGIYQNLVDSMIAVAREHGYTQFQVENTISPQMVAFTKKMGMTEKPCPHGGPPSHWLYL